jgi:hypothetical protein
MATTSADSLRWIPLVFLSLAVLFLGGAALGWLPSGSGSCRGIVFLMGLCLLSGVMLRPAWFWNRRRARRWRAALGDRLYATILIGLALTIVYAALLGTGLEGCSI